MPALMPSQKGFMLKSANGNLYDLLACDVIQPLGKGAFGTVFKANLNNQVFAVKQIPLNNGVPLYVIQNELSTMMKVKEKEGNANIICAHDYAIDEEFYYIVMPYYDQGNLESFINCCKIKSEIEAIEYFRQICYGLMILHSFSIIHRDIKAANIIIDSYDSPYYPYKYSMYIADLGFVSQQKANLTMAVGTPLTRAPEVVSGKYDGRADIYSMGCIFYQMLTKAYPFTGNNDKEVDMAKRAQYLTIPCKLSKLSMWILEGCLQYNASNRLTPSELYKELKIESLYSNYVQTTLEEFDDNKSICLQQFTRKECLQQIKAKNMEIATKNRLIYQSISVDILKQQNKRNSTNSLSCIADKSNKQPHMNHKINVNTEKQKIVETIQIKPSIECKPNSVITKFYPFQTWCDHSFPSHPKIEISFPTTTNKLEMLIKQIDSLANVFGELVDSNSSNKEGFVQATNCFKSIYMFDSSKDASILCFDGPLNKQEFSALLGLICCKANNSLITWKYEVIYALLTFRNHNFKLVEDFVRELKTLFDHRNYKGNTIKDFTETAKALIFTTDQLADSKNSNDIRAFQITTS